MPVPRVRILLLNWNNAADTIACLESVVALDYERFDVVLCDNGSTDGSLDRIAAWADDRLGSHAAAGGRRTPYVTYPRAVAEAGGTPADPPVPLVMIRTGANLGFAGGNNVGLRYILASGGADFVWLLNNDTVVAPHTLRALVDKAAATRDLGAVGGTLLEYRAPDRVQDVAGGVVSRWHGMMSRIDHAKPASAPRAEPARIDFISGCCLLVPVPVLEQVGLLDERFFMYGEDADWGARMRRAGKTLAYAPLAEVWHKGASSAVSGSEGHDYPNVLAPLLMIQKHRPARLPVAALYSVYRCLLPKVVRFQWRRLATVVRAYRDLVTQGAERAASVPATGNAVPAPRPAPVVSEAVREW